MTTPFLKPVEGAVPNPIISMVGSDRRWSLAKSEWSHWTDDDVFVRALMIKKIPL
jgi:hypothetical protein